MQESEKEEDVDEIIAMLKLVSSCKKLFKETIIKIKQMENNDKVCLLMGKDESEKWTFERTEQGLIKIYQDDILKMEIGTNE